MGVSVLTRLSWFLCYRHGSGAERAEGTCLPQVARLLPGELWRRVPGKVPFFLSSSRLLAENNRYAWPCLDVLTGSWVIAHSGFLGLTTLAYSAHEVWFSPEKTPFSNTILVAIFKKVIRDWKDECSGVLFFKICTTEWRNAPVFFLAFTISWDLSLSFFLFLSLTHVLSLFFSSL